MMNDDTLTATRAMQRAVELQRRDDRFRRMTTAVVHCAVQDHGRVDPNTADRDAARIAEAAAGAMLALVYEDDAEIVRLRQERDAYRKIAEDLLKLSPQPLVLTRELSGK